MSAQGRLIHGPKVAPSKPPLTAAAAAATPHHAPAAASSAPRHAPSAATRTPAAVATARNAGAMEMATAAVAEAGHHQRVNSTAGALKPPASAVTAGFPPPPTSSSGPTRSGAKGKGLGSVPTWDHMKSRTDHNVGPSRIGSGSTFNSTYDSTYGSTDLALMAEIKACRDWQVLHHLLAAASSPDSRRRVNQLHSAAALTHLAQMLPPDLGGTACGACAPSGQPPISSSSSSSSSSSPPLGGTGSGEQRFGSGTQPPCLSSLVSELCRLMQKHLPRCGARQVANAAWALAKLSALLEGGGQAEPQQGDHQSHPGMGASLLDPGSTDLHLDPAAAAAMDRLMHALLGRCHLLWDDFNAHEASSLLYAVAQYHQQQNSGRQQKKLGQRLDDGSHRHGISDSTAGPAPLPLSWLDAWLAAAGPLLPDMTPQAVANSCWALAQLLLLLPASLGDDWGGGSAPRGKQAVFLQRLCDVTSDALLGHPARSLALTSWALAKLHVCVGIGIWERVSPGVEGGKGG